MKSTIRIKLYEEGNTPSQDLLEKASNIHIESVEDKVKNINTGLQAYSVNKIQQVVNMGINTAANIPGTIYEDRATQATINNIQSGLNRSIGFAATVAQGATIGGPIGAAVAALGASIMMGVQSYMNGLAWELRQQKFDIDEYRSMESLGMTRSNTNKNR